MMETSAVNWSLCIVCQQDNTSEVIRSPLHNALDVYITFLNNVREFRSANDLPVKLSFGENVEPELFMENNAKWHTTCHQMFNNTKIQRVQDKKQKEIPRY